MTAALALPLSACADDAEDIEPSYPLPTGDEETGSTSLDGSGSTGNGDSAGEVTGGDGDGDGCSVQTDCPALEICDLGECVPPSTLFWTAHYENHDLGCVDGVGECRLEFTTYRWNDLAKDWQVDSWEEMSAVGPDTRFRIVVMEIDTFVDDLIAEFRFDAGGPIEAWKNGPGVYSVCDVNTCDMTIDVRFTFLF